MIDFISQSMLGMFLRCPQQFERRYVNREIIPPGISARRGSGVHKAAAHNFIQKVTSLEDEIVSVLTDVARDEYIRLVKDEGVFIPPDKVGEKEVLLNDGLNATVSLTKCFRENLAPQVQPVIVEERLEVDVGLGIPIQGTLDLAAQDNWLVDIKTAEKSKSKGEADNSLQLSLYAGLYYSRIKTWPSKLSLEILVNTKEPKLQSLETTRGIDEWNNLVMRLRLMLAQIETGLFPPCDPGHWICSPTWCGYYQSCKYSLKRRS